MVRDIMMHEMPAGFGAKNSYANGKRAEAGNVKILLKDVNCRFKALIWFL